MRIKKLSLRNFKGVTDFTLDLQDGKSCSVFGDNATGKSTLFDAFTFLFFGKDSLGKADFEIKTISDGSVVPMLDHSVGGIFDIDGKEVALLKTYREKYTKKRGSVEQVFDGHETDYYIDRVPKTKGEYQKFIAEIAPEELFRLLTSPTHFNEQMKWQDRRAMLLQVCGNVTDSAVIAANPDLKSLQSIISRRSIEDEKKVLMAERKKINEDLQMIPARIDEATKALPGAVGVSAEALMVKAKKASGELAELQNEKSTIENGGAVALKRKELAEIETAIIELKNRHAAVDHGKADREKLAELQRKLSTAIGLKIDETNAKERFETLLSQLTALNKEIVERWKAEKAKVFVRGGACQTCGQEYPENLLDVQEADFNRSRALSLQQVTEHGERNADDIKATRESVDKHTIELTTAINNKEMIESQIDELAKIIESKSQAPDITELPEYQALEAQKKVINDWFNDGNNSPINTVDITEKIFTKQTEINEINAQITAIEMRRNGETRIEELKSQEKDLAKQFEKHEASLFLLEKFTRAKVSMLDESINSRFNIVKFKLFDEQVNGGLAERCTCTVNGVEYGSVNNGHRIAAGADIVSVMQKHYGISCPVFFDNAESCTVTPDMDCQVIKLVVSEPDKKLRVELQ